MTQPILITVHSNEYTSGLCYYSFMVNLERRVGSFNAL